MTSRRPNSSMARLIAHLMSFFAGGIGELEHCVARVLPATAHSRFAAIAIQIGDNHPCTFAANLSTVAPPIPLAAPVMTAAFVSNLPIFFSAVRLTRLAKHDLKSRPSVAQTAARLEGRREPAKGQS